MLSNTFKKTIKATLKNEYGLNCQRIIMYPHQSNFQQHYNRHCTDGVDKSILRLSVHLCRQADEKYTHCFFIYADDPHTECSQQVVDKTYPELVAEAMKEVRGLFSYFNPYYTYVLEHTKICLMFGHFVHGDKGLDIKDITVKVETTSVIEFYNSLDSGRICAHLKIVGNEIFIRPLPIFEGDTTIFNTPTVLESGKMELFKSNFAKTILFYMNDRYKNIADFNAKEDDYMDLDYEDLKRYLLVNSMKNI